MSTQEKIKRKICEDHQAIKLYNEELKYLELQIKRYNMMVEKRQQKLKERELKLQKLQDEQSIV